MSCTTDCFMIGGVQDIYNHGPNGFAIYPHKSFTVEEAKSIPEKKYRIPDFAKISRISSGFFTTFNWNQGLSNM